MWSKIRRVPSTGPFPVSDRAYTWAVPWRGGRRNPGLAVPSLVEYEGGHNFYQSLSHTPDYKNKWVLARWVMDLALLNIDLPPYRSIMVVKQVIWGSLSAGLVGGLISGIKVPAMSFSFAHSGLWWLTLLDHLWRREDPSSKFTRNFTSPFDRSGRIYRKVSTLSLIETPVTNWDFLRAISVDLCSVEVQWKVRICIGWRRFPCNIHPGMKPRNPIFQKGYFHQINDFMNEVYNQRSGLSIAWQKM